MPTIYVKDSFNDTYSHAAEIRSVSEDSSKPIRTFSIRIMRPSPKYTNTQIVVNIPNVRKPVPLFILMRALGVISDYDIIETCLLDRNEFILSQNILSVRTSLSNLSNGQNSSGGYGTFR